MSILRYRQDDLPTGIWNGIVLSAPLWLLIALCLFAASANATSPTKQPVQDQDVSAEASSVSTSESASDNAVSVDASRYGIALGGGASGSDSTAACLERRPSWGFGFRGDKTKLNAVCWGEYVRQAEHEREMDLAAMELERARLELEREIAQLERLRLEQCLECGDK